MSAQESSVVERVSEDGFTVIEAVFDAADCHRFVTDLEAALAVSDDEKTVLRRANGVIYGARNLLAIFPHAIRLWRKQQLINVLTKVLGPRLGLVRGLYFDKPPDSTWSLPWHQDLTIAVQNNALPSEQFRNRTTKAGVPHVEAPDDLLRQMLTLRIHLDDVTEENGPLQVLPGTHVSRATPSKRPPVTIVAKMGDVLAMRPLLSHCSGVSAADTIRHRRVIHLEFSAVRELPDAYQWHQFFPLLDAAT
jgi:ectoine hydroxylase-related dioxygenase (phytanoyl-CoA dioxygenase family)